MTEYTTADTRRSPHRRCRPAPAEDDRIIMAKIRSILGRGNNAEVKQKTDGTVTVMEVKKNIV